MTFFWSIFVFIGTAIFAFSFFLPPHFYNSPQSRLLWALDAAFPVVDRGESLAFMGVSLAICYPYFWGLIAAITFLLANHVNKKIAYRSQLFCHLLGGIPIAALGVLLLILQDSFVSQTAQWAAALAPFVIVILIVIMGSVFSGSRRLAGVTALSLLIFIPLQLILAYYVMLDGGSWWGFCLGAGGGIIGLVGCINIFIQSG